MKITKKVTSIVLALMLVISAFAGLSITASAATLPTGNVTLHIFKYEGTASDINLDNRATGWQGENEGATTVGTDGEPIGRIDGKTPIEKVEFTAWKIGGVNDTVPTEEADSYNTSALGEGTKLTTDEYGHATMSIESADFGLYVVKETFAPDKVTTKSVGFYVYLPMTDSDGDAYLTDVYVYPKNVVTLGGGMLTKKINNADYDRNEITTAPVFELYEDITDGDDVLIATYTLPSATDDATATVNASTIVGTRYEAVTAAASNDGKIAVNGLPTGTYYWSEKSGATLTDGTVIPVNTSKPNIVVSSSGSVDTSKWTLSGSATNVNFDNSQTSTLKKEVELQDGSYSDNSLDTAGTVNSTYDIGDTFNWKVTVDIPNDIATYTSFVVTDDIDPRLDYKSITVGSLTADTEELTNDYAITTPEVNGDGMITITFVDATKDPDTGTLSGRTASAGLQALAGSQLEITIETAINSTATVDTAIPNQAKLAFNNGVGTSDEVESTTPKVYTGGFQIEKVDAANSETKLSGVEFTLYDGDTAVNVVKTGTADGDYVVCPAGTEGATTTLITDTNGLIKVKGLQYSASPTSQYTLVETKTNAGYQLLSDPTPISVADGTYDDTLVSIQNLKQPDLPLTGGMGTILFTVAGLVLIGGAAFFFIRSRKSSKEEA